MKAFKRSFLAIIILVINFEIASAQQLILGTFPSSNQSLLSVRYRNVRNVNSHQNQANFTGIHDVGSNRRGSTRSEQAFNYNTSGSYRFAITFNQVANTLVSSTIINGTTLTNTFTNVTSKLTADGKTTNPSTINLIRISVRTQTGNSTIMISNLKIEGLSIKGNYGRSNNVGISEWFASSPLLNNGFTISGDVALSGNFSNSPEGQRIEITFGYTSNPGAAVLPLGLENFNVKSNAAGGNMVQWNTLYENNTSHFEIQRSVDESHYSTVGTVPAAGESNALRSYSYHDRSAGNYTWYYRLASKDKDGKQSFSAIIKVRGDGNGLTPSVIKYSTTQISIQFPQKDIRTIRVLDMNGRVHYLLQTKEQLLDVNISSLVFGSYLLQIVKADGTAEIHRFLR